MAWPPRLVAPHAAVSDSESWVSELLILPTGASYAYLRMSSIDADALAAAVALATAGLSQFHSLHFGTPAPTRPASQHSESGWPLPSAAAANAALTTNCDPEEEQPPAHSGPTVFELTPEWAHLLSRRWSTPLSRQQRRKERKKLKSRGGKNGKT